MKILAVADEECPALWDYYIPGRLDGYELILSCGDLKADYLTFLVTMGHGRLLYVHGNHDESYDFHPPEGCEDIDGHLVIFNGYRILGLGGCMRYHPGGYQYTDKEMQKRLKGLRRAIKKAGGVDIVITHAPPKGLGDLDDPAHRGFEAFLQLIEEYRPLLFLHGHTHLRYNSAVPREQRHGDTRIVNCTERFTLDLPDRAVNVAEKGEVKWVTRHKEGWR